MWLFSFLTTLVYLLFIFLVLVTFFLWLIGKHRESRLSANNIDLQHNQQCNQSTRRSSGFSTIDPTPTVVPRRLSFSGGIQTPISAPPLSSKSNHFETTTPTYRRSPHRRVTFSLTPEQQRNEYYKIAMQRRAQSRTPIVLLTPPNNHIPVEKLFPNNPIQKPSNIDLATTSSRIAVREQTPKVRSVPIVMRPKETQIEKEEEPLVEEIFDNEINVKLDRTPQQRLSTSFFNNNSINRFTRYEDQNHHSNTFPLIHKSMPKRKPVYYEDMITNHTQEDHAHADKNNYSKTKNELQKGGDASDKIIDEPQPGPKDKESTGLFTFGDPGRNLSEREAFLKGSVQQVSQPNMRSFRFEIGKPSDMKFMSGALR